MKRPTWLGGRPTVTPAAESTEDPIERRARLVAIEREEKYQRDLAVAQAVNAAREAEAARQQARAREASRQEIEDTIKQQGVWLPRRSSASRLSARRSRLEQFAEAIRVGWDAAKRLK